MSDNNGAMVRHQQTTAIAHGRQYEPSNWAELMNAAKFLCKSSLVPSKLRDKPEDVTLVLLTGAQRGMSIATSLSSIHIIEGRPSLSAEAIRALVLGSGVAEYIECTEHSSEAVTWETKRVGGRNSQTCRWTTADAQKAGLLNKDNWRKYPAAMLSARASMDLCRMVYSDVTLGLYTPDEIRNMEPEEREAVVVSSGPSVGGGEAIEAEIVDPETGECIEQPTAPNLPADWQPPAEEKPPSVADALAAMGDPGAWS